MSTEANLDSLSYRELQRVCTIFGLRAFGKKESLQKRLVKMLAEKPTANLQAAVDQARTEEDAEEEAFAESEAGQDAAPAGDADGQAAAAAGASSSSAGAGPATPRARSEVLSQNIMPQSPEGPTGSDNDMLGFSDTELGAEPAAGKSKLKLKAVLSRSMLARSVVNVFLLIEFCALLYALCAVDYKPNAELVNADGSIKKQTTVVELAVDALAQRVPVWAFWQNLFAYAGLLLVGPTFLGLLMGKYAAPESVFGFAVSRYAIYYLLRDVSQFAFMPLYMSEKLFTTHCAIAVLTAFWEKQG